MLHILKALTRPRASRTPQRHARPLLEGLEDRQLLYAATGGLWAHSERITFSFVPDGTSVGGVASNLYSKMNAIAPTATWQAAFERAAVIWSSYADINLALVPDNGAPIGTAGNQQGDSRFGDIRIAAIPQSTGTLAYALMAPPINGGTDAGDVIFNSNVNWHVNTDYDIQTVAMHEFGHALGLDHTAVSNAVMYAYYNGIKQSLTSDDLAGMQSLYGPMPADLDANQTYLTALNITGSINGAGQLALPNQMLSGNLDYDWYYVTVPWYTTGTMTVSMQSTNLSTAAPRLVIYNSALTAIGQNTLPNAYGATATISVSGVKGGQGFYIRCSAASGLGSYGAYGLLANFGPYAQQPIQPPYTVVPEQPDQGGGSVSDTAVVKTNQGHQWGTKKGEDGPSTTITNALEAGLVQIGTLVSHGDALMAKDLLLDGNAGKRSRTMPTLDDGSAVTVLPDDRTVVVNVSLAAVSPNASNKGKGNGRCDGNDDSTIVVLPPGAVDDALAQFGDDEGKAKGRGKS